MSLRYVDPSERFNPGFTHGYNPETERIRKAGDIWGSDWKNRIQTLPYQPEIGRDWRDSVQTLPYVPDGQDWRDKIQTLPYRY